MLGPQQKFDFKERPFEAVQGEHFDFSRPWYDMRIQLAGVHQLLASPEDWVARLISRLQWLDPMTTGYDDRPQFVRARAAYLEVIKMHTSGLVYGSEERSAMPSGTTVLLSTMDAAKRGSGLDWTYLGDTMTGVARLNSLKLLLEDVFLHGIPGDYMETGVWRGGSSIFARAVMRSYHEGHRMSYVCDSFQGLPPGDRALDPGDKGWVEELSALWYNVVVSRKDIVTTPSRCDIIIDTERSVERARLFDAFGQEDLLDVFSDDDNGIHESLFKLCVFFKFSYLVAKMGFGHRHGHTSLYHFLVTKIRPPRVTG